MDIEEMKAKVDEFFAQNPEFETTMTKKDWIEGEELITIMVYQTIRRSYSKLSKIRKRKINTSDVSKIMLETIIEVTEEW